MSMGDEAANPAVDSAAGESGSARRERSTIEFPYMDLEMALAVARGAFARNGQSECSNDELAVQLELSPNSSGFRIRLASAKTFGLIHSERGSDRVKLTELGLRVLNPETERKAKVDAFLNVELFRRVYEHYKGNPLPPADALQREMQNMGVARKQAERARQIMERSASTAGFFESGRNKLVRPARLDVGGADATPDPEAGGGTGGEQDGAGSQKPQKRGLSGGEKLDPIIQGLLARLPKSGDVWPESERNLWLELLKGSFRLIYKDKKEQSTHSDSENASA